MNDVLVTLVNWHAMEILFALAVVLVLVDYFFPVDYPAYLGYLCFAAGMFFAVPFGVVTSLLAAFLIWMVLLVLHRLLFTRFLTNAPGAQRS